MEPAREEHQELSALIARACSGKGEACAPAVNRDRPAPGARGEPLVAKAPATNGIPVSRETDSAASEGTGGSPDLESRIEACRGGGRPLDAGSRDFFESRFGTGFGHVRIHTGGEADAMNRELGARAFTTGKDIYFANGEHNPESSAGRELLAHELTHVVQQSGGVRPKLLVSPVDDPSEREADQVASRVMRMPDGSGRAGSIRATPLSSDTVHRFRSEGGVGTLPPADSGAARTTDAFHEPPEERGLQSAGSHTATGTFLRAEARAPHGFLATEQIQDEEIATQEPTLNPARSHSTETPRGEPPTYSATELASSATLAPDSPAATESTGEAPPSPSGGTPSGSNAEVELGADAAFPDAGSELTASAGSEPIGMAPPSFAGDAALPATASATVTIQREAEDNDESGGLLAGIRARIGAVVDGVTQGWSALTSTAETAIGSLQAQFGAVRNTLASFGSALVETLRAGWSSVSGLASSLAEGVLNRVRSGVGAVVNLVRAFAGAAVRMDADGVRMAWSRLGAAMAGLWQGVQNAGRAVLGTLQGLWTGLRTRLTTMLAGLGNMARSLFSALGNAASAIGNRLRSLWSGLQQRTSQLPDIAGRVLDLIRRLVEPLLAAARRVWSGIQNLWTRLLQRFAGIWQGLQSAAAAIWGAVQARAATFWQGVVAGWNRVRTWIAARVQGWGAGLLSLWNRLRAFSPARLIQTIAAASPFLRSLGQAVSDPNSATEPLVTTIAGKVEAEMPQRALDEGRRRGGENEAGPSGTTATVRRKPAPGALLVQRQPRSTATWSEIWDGFSTAITYKWRQLRILTLIKETLWNMIWPWPAVGREFVGLGNDWVTSWDDFFTPRSPLSNPLDTLHDLWTNLLHILDFVLALWRRLNNILLLLMGWVTIALVVLGAIGGSLAGTVIGGILSGLATLGIAAPAGATAGAGAGGLAGAGAGLAAAAGIGLVLLISYVAGEAAAFTKALADLKTGRQTEAEKRRDYSQMADSLIGIGTAGVLFLLSWIAGRLAAAFVTWVRKFLPPRRAPATPTPGTPETPGRTNTRVPGLYEGIDPAQPPTGWQFTDTVTTSGETTNVRTQVTAPDGSTGNMARSFDASTGELSMDYAFLDRIPSAERWVQTNPEMVAGRGTPLETYMTMRQMRIIEKAVGAAFTGPRTVHMSMIINSRTCLQLGAMETARGAPLTPAELNSAILNTHSVQYANNSIVQSGGRIASARVSGGSRMRAGDIATPEELTTHQVPADQQVPYGFDIDLNVVPAETPPPPGTPAPRSVPVPPAGPPPRRDDQGPP